MSREEHPTADVVRAALRAAFKCSGSMSEWARRNAICKTTLSRMMSSKRPVSARAAEAVGFFPVTAYMRAAMSNEQTNSHTPMPSAEFRAGVHHATKFLYPLFAEIIGERQRQDDQWGGEAHDDAHEAADWWEFILHQYHNVNAETHRERLLKVAALAVAGIESFDRKAKAGA